MSSKVAIVTGAGQGVGEGIAAATTKEGAKMVLTCRTLSKVERVADVIRELGGEVRCIGGLSGERAVAEQARWRSDFSLRPGRLDRQQRPILRAASHGRRDPRGIYPHQLRIRFHGFATVHAGGFPLTAGPGRRFNHQHGFGLFLILASRICRLWRDEGSNPRADPHGGARME